ncbi:MAG: phospholipase D-like domain-containing protein [archaeon]|nr:phospholipase D-like domain-containing protein [archaeon]
MHKRMGTTAVLLVVLLASFAVAVSDYSDAESPAVGPNSLGESSYMFDSTVTPFTFPECKGIPVMNAINDATTSIRISVYLFSSKETIALLSQKANAGVKVEVLIDGTPLGVSSNNEMLMQLDQQYHGDVRLINFKGAENAQFDYLHNKYAIIDEKKVIITSENWTQGNFSSSTGNRGWGAIIESPAYASYMYNNIFKHDFEDDNDVNKIEDVYSPSIASKDAVGTYTLKSYTTTSYSGVKVYPAHSPDTSFNLMKEYMGTATTRLYVEELDISPKYANYTTDGPIKWMVDKANAGVDVKYVLDISYEKPKDQAHSQLIYDLNHDTKVKASPIKGGTGFSITHNKGIIVDDAVWVGSVNMTPTSFHEDREMAVIIYSADVANFYATSFNKDFNNNYDPEYKPGEYTMVNRVVDEVEEHPWYLAVIAVAIAALGIIVKKVLIGGAKGGKKGAQKAAKSAGKSAAKKVFKSAAKEYSKSKKKK